MSTHIVRGFDQTSREAECMDAIQRAKLLAGSLACTGRMQRAHLRERNEESGVNASPPLSGRSRPPAATSPSLRL